MKKLSLLLALVMMMTCIALPSFAEESAIKESASGFYYIEANGDQIRLSAASADKFFQVDGLWFKDLNGNGTLDVYEDWRQDVEARVADLTAQMTMDEKGGLLLFACIAGQNGSTVTDFNADISGFGGGGSDAATAASASVVNLESPAINDPDNLSVDMGGKVYRSTRYQIQTMFVNTFIAALTGVPKDQLDIFNRLQTYAEDTRLGIPATFSGDRTYNTWGGMIDAAHYAFGVAHDPELLYNLMSEYAKESVAIGYHQVFHGYGNEIGSWYGDDPSYIALMSATETKAYEDNGFQSHSKHFIARGGRNSYANAKSPANLIDSWKIGWQAVVDAGTQYIMTNNNIGVTPGVQGYMDKDTYDILRNELGYDGVVCLDWPLGDTSLMSKTGILRDGTDISTLSLVERYALILNAGVDMFSCSIGVPGTDVTDEAYTDIFMHARPQVVVQAVTEGLVTEEDLNVHVGRVLRTKFAYGLFDNPYRDWGELLDLIGTDAYKAEQTIPLSNEAIDVYRRPEIIALEEELMVKSTIVYKNDGILPLTADAKVYVDANGGTKDAIAAAIAEKAEIVDDIENATVVVYHATSFNDAYEVAIEDAKDAGIPVVLIYEGTNSAEPGLQQFIDANALVMQTYRNTPDHGSSVGAFYRYVTPSITADMLFGAKEPTGKTLFEIGYASDAKALSWGELQDDIGVTDALRLYMAMLAKENPAIEMPNNLGDVIVTDNFGIEYSKPADIQLSLLTVPREAITVTTETNGRVRTSVQINNKAKAGQEFEINFVAKNVGEGDGLITVPVLVNGEAVAEKLVGVTAGQFRVITMRLTLDAGEYEIAVGDLTAAITVE
ncbi:MAG: glycoside hydrolase family 3 protein [Clostridia bacterium]|nr:glycoside hydrolase family 3 protein [Clostridia bacterium]